ncbi:MAG: response regulator transcription factor [Bacteroidales bacterium]|nr:response regulator transcription factor [Bacteroidales bacterium]
MQNISLGIFDEYLLMQQGIHALLDKEHALQVVFCCSEPEKIAEQLKAQPANILLMNIHEFNNNNVELIRKISFGFPRTKIIILSYHTTEELVLKTIKAGAKGFLSKHATKNELVEAIYTVRSGYDYYSASITQLLVNKYISKLKTDENKEPEAGIKNLSTRQTEILKLWGEGFSNQDIADKLFISIRTVESHKNHIMQKLNLKTTVDMVKFAIKNNLIEI